MSKRRSNKSVKRMMVDVFDGEWVNYNHGNPRLNSKGMRLHVFGGWLDKHRTTVELYKTISLTASELKVE